VKEELQITKMVLDCFGEASGLYTNLQKSFVIPIRCDEGSFRSGRRYFTLPYFSIFLHHLELPILNKNFRKGDLMPIETRKDCRPPP
jgi:hypothetical protein